MSTTRTRWAAIGAAIAVTLGAGGIGLVGATSPTDATAYQPITPCRMVDTRSSPDVNVGDRNTPLGPAETHVVAAISPGDECGEIPKNVAGLQLNVTALNATAPTFLSVWGDGDQPNTSSLNPVPGQPPTPNAVTTGLDSTRRFHIFNKFGFVDVIVDVVGIYSDHDHDDRYYTKTQTDSKLAAKANTRAVYTEDEVDELLAAQRVLTAGDATDDAPNFAEDVEQYLVSAVIDVPVSGTVHITGGANGLAFDAASWGCWLRVDATDVVGTYRADERACNTAGMFQIGPGVHSLHLMAQNNSSGVQVLAANVSAVFVPNG